MIGTSALAGGAKFYGSRLGFVLARIEAYSIGSGEAEIATGIFRNSSDSVARRLLYVWTYFSGVPVYRISRDCCL